MKKNLLFCPSCGNRLHVSKISCDNCGIEINGNFEIPLFDEDDFEFIKDFIMFEGNISKMQLKYGETYKVIKDKINNIKEKIGGEEMCKKKNVDFSHNSTDSAVIQCLQKKIEQCAGKGYIPTLKGENIPFWIADDQSGFVVKQLKNVVFTFEMFDDIVKKANELGGKMYRGDAAAQAGERLGSEKLSYDTIDGFLADKYFDTKENETVTRRSTYIAGILAWAGIATNHKSEGQGGYITINPLFRE